MNKGKCTKKRAGEFSEEESYHNAWQSFSAESVMEGSVMAGIYINRYSPISTSIGPRPPHCLTRAKKLNEEWVCRLKKVGNHCSKANINADADHNEHDDDDFLQAFLAYTLKIELPKFHRKQVEPDSASDR